MAVAVVFLAACSSGSPATGPEDPPIDSLGTVRITTTTMGEDPDPDGYKAEANWGEQIASVDVPVNGTGSMKVVPTNCDEWDDLCGYRVSLTGLAPNCAVEPTADWWSTTRQVPVDSGQTKEVSFTVRCEPVASARLPAGTRLAFVREGRIHAVDSDGSNAVELTEGPEDGSPAWSPDGQRIVFTRGDWAGRDIYIMNADGSDLTRLTQGGYHEDPAFSPDGTRIVYASSGIRTMSAVPDGSASIPVVVEPGWQAQPAWTPGGDIGFVSDWVAYDFAADVFVTNTTGSTTTAITHGFVPGAVRQFYQPVWSPDGRLIAVVECPQAYATCDAATITLLKADGSLHGRVGLTSGWAHPTWSPDGRTIAYARGGLILWVRADGSERGLVVTGGHSPVWRP